MRKASQILIFLILPLVSSYPQDKKSFAFNGYVSLMPSVMFDSLSGKFSYDNLIHNRLNLKWYEGSHFSCAIELRNRIFSGNMVKTDVGYAKLIGNDPGLIDLSWNIVNDKSLLINTTVDRYWLDLNYEKFQIRIGRQRVNWGQTLIWNPNDIFNAYSFYDFDYVEKPGSDAIRLQYFPGSTSTLEMAFKADQEEYITGAGLYRFNKWGYDIQILAGCFESRDLVAGAGWSGAMGSVSFRGEASWFQPVKHYSDSTGRGLFTIGFDKAFKDNSMAQIQIMYCNNPLKLTDFNSFYSGNLSSKDLAFSRFTAFGEFSYSVSALFTASVSAMWFPDLKGYFAGPSLDYSLTENLDFSLIWQHFDSKMSGDRTKVNMVFLRLKYSF